MRGRGVRAAPAATVGLAPASGVGEEELARWMQSVNARRQEVCTPYRVAAGAAAVLSVCGPDVITRPVKQVCRGRPMIMSEAPDQNRLLAVYMTGLQQRAAVERKSSA